MSGFTCRPLAPKHASMHCPISSKAVLQEILLPQLVLRLVPTPDATVLVRLLSEHMAAATGLAAPTLEQAFTERLRRGGVALPEGVAFPHAVIAGVRQTVLGLILVPGGIELDPNQPPSELVFAIAGDSARPWEHVRLLARLSLIASDPQARKRLVASPDNESLLKNLMQEDSAHG